MLLKNDGVLPFKPSVRRIAAIGLAVDDLSTLMGDYNGDALASGDGPGGLRRRLEGAPLHLPTPSASRNEPFAKGKGDRVREGMRFGAVRPDDNAVEVGASSETFVRGWACESEGNRQATLRVPTPMRKLGKVVLGSVCLYAIAWSGYVVKSAAGIDLIHDGVHHGPWFPGSDAVVARLRREFADAPGMVTRA